MTSHKPVRIIILSFLMWIAAAFVSFAATVYTEDAFFYIIEDKSITITGYFGDDTVVNVPSVIAGLPVNRIAPYAFEGTGVQIVNLPETIESVEKSAFDASTQVNYFQREENTRPNLGDDTEPDDAGGEVETLPTGSQESTEEETSPAESQGSTEEETLPAESQSSREEESAPSQQETTAAGTGESSSKEPSSAGGYVSVHVSDRGLSPDGPASAGTNADGMNGAGTNAAGTGTGSTAAGSAEASEERQGAAGDTKARESQESALSGHIEEVVEDGDYFTGEEPGDETVEELPSAAETAGTSANEAAGTENSAGKHGSSFGILAAVIVLFLFLVFFVTRKKKKEQQNGK